MNPRRGRKRSNATNNQTAKKGITADFPPESSDQLCCFGRSACDATDESTSEQRWQPVCRLQPHATDTQLQLRNFMINFITVLLQFGSFKIHFMKIQLSSMILRKFFGNSVHFFELEDTFTKKHRKLSKPQSVEFPPTESVPCLFTDSPVKKTLPSLNQ